MSVLGTMLCFRVICSAFFTSPSVAHINDARRNLSGVSLKEHGNFNKAGPRYGSFEMTPQIAICKCIGTAHSKMTHEQTK